MELRERPYLEVKLVTNGKIGHRENTKKIKVPFHCFFSKSGLTKKLGMVSMNNACYYLVDLTKQRKTTEDVDSQAELDTLLINNNIEVCKVKIIAYQ